MPWEEPKNLPKQKKFTAITTLHDLSTSVSSADWFQGTDTVFHVAAKAGMGGNFTEYLQANLVSTEKL